MGVDAIKEIAARRGDDADVMYLVREVALLRGRLFIAVDALRVFARFNDVTRDIFDDIARAREVVRDYDEGGRK